MADSPYTVGNALDSFQLGQMNAQKLQTGDLQNQQLSAQLPGIVGQSQSLAAKGQVDQQTLPQAIDMIKSQTLSKMSDNDAKMTTNMGGQIAQFGAMLDSIPAPARAAAVAQFASKFNMPPDSPLMKGILATDPEKLPEAVKAIGTNMVQLSSDYIKNAGMLNIKGNNAVNAATVGANARRDVAGINAGSRLEVADLNNQSAEKRAQAANALRVQLQETKAKSPQQLVASRMQQFQSDPSQENRDLLQQSIDVAQSVTQNPQLMKLFQDASVGQSVLPGLPNTVPQPQQNPAANFPTGPSAPQAPAAAPTATAPKLPPGAKMVGTAGGVPVYELNGKRYKLQQ